MVAAHEWSRQGIARITRVVDAPSAQGDALWAQGCALHDASVRMQLADR
jgi:hypothetical protein